LNNLKNQIKLESDRGKNDDRIHQLTSLLKEADKTQRELLNKFSEEANKRKSLESDNANIVNENNHLRNMIREKEVELQNLNLGLESMNNNYDNLNNELDLKTEEQAKLTVLVRDLQKQNEDLVGKYSQNTNKINIDNKRLVEREIEINELKNKLVDAVNHINILQIEIRDKDNLIDTLNFDLNTKNNENQEIINDLTRIAKENEKLYLIKNQLESNSEMFNQKFRANELDMTEIYQAYKESCLKNKKYEENLQLFVEENRLAAQKLKEQKSLIENYDNVLQQQMLEKDELTKKNCL
jgi:chromosome segregation ATPase